MNNHEKSMKSIGIATVILVFLSLIFSGMTYYQAHSLLTTQNKEIKLLKKKLTATGGNGVNSSYTFEVYYAPSLKEATAMQKNWQTNDKVLRVFVQATGRVDAKLQAMNDKKIDEQQILHVVNPDGTSNDGWIPPHFLGNNDR